MLVRQGERCFGLEPHWLSTSARIRDAGEGCGLVTNQQPIIGHVTLVKRYYQCTVTSANVNATRIAAYRR